MISWCHELLAWLPLGLLVLALPPMVFFPSRLWAHRLISLCGFGVLAGIGVFHLSTYSTHWDLSHWLVAPGGRCYIDGCLVHDDGQIWEWAIRYGRLFNRSLLASLLVVSGGCFWFDAWLQRRRAARPGNRRQDSGIHWVEDQS